MKRRKNSNKENKETEMRKLIKRAEQALRETRRALKSAKKIAILLRNFSYKSAMAKEVPKWKRYAKNKEGKILISEEKEVKRR